MLCYINWILFYLLRLFGDSKGKERREREEKIFSYTYKTQFVISWSCNPHSYKIIYKI